MLITEGKRVEGVRESVFLGSLDLTFDSELSGELSDEEILSEFEMLKSRATAEVEGKIASLGGNALTSASFTFSGDKFTRLISVVVKGSVYRVK